jgi:hypothetical protein
MPTSVEDSAADSETGNAARLPSHQVTRTRRTGHCPVLLLFPKPDALAVLALRSPKPDQHPHRTILTSFPSDFGLRIADFDLTSDF